MGGGTLPGPPLLFARFRSRGATLIVVAYAVLALVGPARADFAEGLAAYDGGDYYAAYLAWLPLAKAGDGDARAAIADLYLSELLNLPAGANERRRVRRTAAWWYRQAAGCGHVVGQLNLGELYLHGIGVDRDPLQAHLWLGLAAKGGNAWAAGLRDRISETLTPAQRAEAEARLLAWSAAAECSD